MLIGFFKNISIKQWIQVITIVVITCMTINFYSNIKDYVETKLGMETKATLKAETITQKTIINDLKEANVDLAKDIDKKDESNKVNTEIIVNKFKAESKIDSKIESIKIKKVEDIQQIKNDFNNKPKTVENAQEEERQISIKQINSLWATYCTDESNSVQCEQVTNKVAT